MESKDSSRRARVGDDDDNQDAYSVGWNEPADQDPENPMAWPEGRKWGIITTISFLSFLT
jgi:hypothetical protein